MALAVYRAEAKSAGTTGGWASKGAGKGDAARGSDLSAAGESITALLL